MKDVIILLSKDILCAGYLPVYGNKAWKGYTPNLDQLAEKGTVFQRHYTAAPSTAMAFTSMSTGKYPYELNRKNYEHVEEYKDTSTIFQEFRIRGYECHIVWSQNYMAKALPYARCFDSPYTKIHAIDINQPVGPHIKGLNELKSDELKAKKTMDLLYNEIEKLPKSKLFLWIHLPHVILGRDSYGSDMDLFDQLIGFLRERYNDNIYITGDHGNMNGEKGKWAYGFDVYEKAIHIPFIAPRIDGMDEVSFPTSNIQLKEILLNRKLSRQDYILSDSAYYAQPHRKLAIIKDRYKLIYDKKLKKKELYDIEYDPHEDVNLYEKIAWDIDRKRKVNIKEVYFYPNWKESELALQDLEEIFQRIWKEESGLEKAGSKIFYGIRQPLARIYGKYAIRKKANRK